MRTLVLTTALGLLTALPAAADTKMTDEERSAFRAEVRAYLLEEPEVLMEAIAVLEEKRNADAAAADIALLKTNHDEIFNDPASWVGGNPDGDITVVEFMDYNCGYCKKAFAEVAELIESDGNIRFVVKEFPILGDDSVLASRFAVAVLQVEGAAVYEKAHNAMMQAKSKATPETLEALAREVGVSDWAAVKAAMDSPEVNAVISANHALGQRLDINGTPTFVIDETLVRGYVPLDGMRQIVDGQRKG